MFGVNDHSGARTLSAPRLLLCLTAIVGALASMGSGRTAAQQTHRGARKGGFAELSSAGPQQHQGDLFIADKEVEIRYGDQLLHADHVEYNEKTFEVYARGHVQYDFENQHIEGDEAHYNVSTGHGTFHNVRATIRVVRRPNPAILVTNNPLYIEAEEVERFGDGGYVVRKAWITVCNPQHPKWQFFAPQARLRVDNKVALVNTNFRLVRVPLVWIPYATLPVGPKIRQTGFLVPAIGNSTTKGFVLGDAFYWAPTTWMDATIGAELLTRRGWAQRGQLRAKPWQNTSVQYSYFGVIDRGIPVAGANGVQVLQSQGGHEQRIEVQSLLPRNWRFVADVNTLSSLRFRLAFADTFGDAINSEVRSSIFLTHNFNGFSLNFAALNDRSFLTTNPVQTSVFLRNTPQARFGSVEQAPWRNLPVYFGFDAFAGALHRDDNQIETPAAVGRTEFAPWVTVPVHFGRWANITTTAAFRSTYYGASLAPGPTVNKQSITRNDGEFTVDLRAPTLERIFRPNSRHGYKHTIEPEIKYRYVTGINDFQRFIRFDADSTLANTNEVEYGLTQRLYRKTGDAQPQELISWRLVQKHYFDTTFGGAIVPGQRNVIEPLYSVTPFAFALGPRNSSPIVSTFRIAPGGIYDTEQILEYDPQLRKIVTIGTLVKVKPYKEFFTTIAHFRLQADPILQPLSNQVRMLIGYGTETRKGFNMVTGLSYDVTNGQLQNQLVQISYNGSCCGLALEYRRIALGQVRTENQFRVAFIIANIGTFGNLRHRERIF
jgi:LPS-assembly protein